MSTETQEDKFKVLLDWGFIQLEDPRLETTIFFKRLKRFDTNMSTDVILSMPEVYQQDTAKQVKELMIQRIDAAGLFLWPIKKKAIGG